QKQRQAHSAAPMSAIGPGHPAAAKLPLQVLTIAGNAVVGKHTSRNGCGAQLSYWAAFNPMFRRLLRLISAVIEPRSYRQSWVLRENRGNPEFFS
ncbi:hypothetical protein, partial [Leisingera sp. F5]|uniref:hypothetical protein n=1 Tax=Leisingera sp. F5 TaxID=1813816 RepID=UPI0025C4F0A7